MDELTIYDIAEKAGVSASTVSRVINNYAHVKKSTRAKVQKILSECNFVPNETARNLVTQSSRMIGILISDIRTTHYTTCIYFLEQEFSKRGYSCIICNTGTEPEKQAACLQQLSTKKMDAMVLIGSSYQNDSMKEAIRTYTPSMPISICNGYLENENVYGVISDERTGTGQCAELFISKGRKNLAFIYNQDTPSSKEKLVGFSSKVKELTGKDAISILSGTSVAEITDATRKLCANHPETDAILFSDDYVAMIGMHVLTVIGKKIPQDIAVMGINNSQYARICNPPLSTLDNKLYDTSISAVRNILQVIDGEHALKKMILCPEIIERSTT